MGLLDKLFGSAGNEVLKQLKDAAQSVAKEATNAMNNMSGNTNAADSSNAYRPQTGSAATIRPTQRPASGDSWGAEMPAEENQFNSGKSYEQYFYDIFTGSFPSYRVTTEKIRNGRATLITLWEGLTENKALVVELMSEASSAQSTRVQCQREGVPYLRFYYDHDGWWNTKSYVIRRTREALK